MKKKEDLQRNNLQQAIKTSSKDDYFRKEVRDYVRSKGLNSLDKEVEDEIVKTKDKKKLVDVVNRILSIEDI